ncbi:MAG: endonuclease NucS [Proteobacteria bacterium]|nr:endonuclease NucS [Pseudomonadota bacterium]
MKNYNRIMLGRKSVYAQECFDGNYIGAYFGIDEDFTDQLSEDWREFNKKFIPVFLEGHPDKSKVTAGLACGALWTISKGLKRGDIVLCPDGNGNYQLAEISGEYYYVPDTNLPHRRPVKWLGIAIARSEMSESLRNSAGSIGTVCELKPHSEEIERFLQPLSNIKSGLASVNNEEIEDLVSFTMEKHLEDFLVANWAQTELAKQFDIYEEDGERVGQQYQTGAGVIDILAISKDKKRLLVVELKRGRASDKVVGQILRYMGYIKEQIAETNQSVEGVIIALEDDQTMRWAISNVPSISFYKYQVSFKLVKA